MLGLENWIKMLLRTKRENWIKMLLTLNKSFTATQTLQKQCWVSAPLWMIWIWIRTKKEHWMKMLLLFELPDIEILMQFRHSKSDAGSRRLFEMNENWIKMLLLLNSQTLNCKTLNLNIKVMLLLRHSKSDAGSRRLFEWLTDQGGRRRLLWVPCQVCISFVFPLYILCISFVYPLYLFLYLYNFECKRQKTKMQKHRLRRATSAVLGS